MIENVLLVPLTLVDSLTYTLFIVCVAPSIPMLLQVADSILLVHNAAEKLDLFGELCLDCITAQGLPSTVHAVQVQSVPINGFSTTLKLL